MTAITNPRHIATALIALALGMLTFSTFQKDETLPAIAASISITLSAFLVTQRTSETAREALGDHRPIRQSHARTALAAGCAVASLTGAIGVTSHLDPQMTAILAAFLLGFTTILLHTAREKRPASNHTRTASDTSPQG